MTDKITLRLVEHGSLEVEVDRVAYEEAKHGGFLDGFLDTQASGIDSDWWIVEPDGKVVWP